MTDQRPDIQRYIEAYVGLLTVSPGDFSLLWRDLVAHLAEGGGHMVGTPTVHLEKMAAMCAAVLQMRAQEEQEYPLLDVLGVQQS